MSKKDMWVCVVSGHMQSLDDWKDDCEHLGGDWEDLKADLEPVMFDKNGLPTLDVREWTGEWYGE